MKRGDIVTVVLPGAYGKPRPAVVVQDDFFDQLPSVTLLPITSARIEADLLRLPVPQGAETGLRAPSQIMVDKVMTVPRSKTGAVIGQAPEDLMKAVDTALSRFLGLPPAGEPSPS